jgi:hypothetical protein
MFDILMCLAREGVLLQMTFRGLDPNLESIVHFDNHLLT